MGSSLKKDLDKLQALAREQGWVVTLTANDHWQWAPPDSGRPVITSKTPSDPNVLEVIKRDLRRGGLILDRGELRRMRNQARQAAAAKTITAQERQQMVMENMVAQGFGEQLATYTEQQIDVMLKYADENGDIMLTCIHHDPPREFANPLGAAMHFEKCKPPPIIVERPVSVAAPVEAPPEVVRPQCRWLACKQTFSKEGFRNRHEDKCVHRPCPCKGTPEHTLDEHNSWERKYAQCDRPYIGKPPHCGDPRCFKYHPADRGVVPVLATIPAKPTEFVAGTRPEGDTVFCGACDTEILVEKLQEHRRVHMDSDPQPTVTPEPTVPAVPPVLARVDPPAPTAVDTTPPPSTAPVAPIKSEPTEEELWALLEMVLDGPVRVNKDTLLAINQWMEATKRLFEVRAA